MLLSLPRLAVFLSFVVIGVASQNIPGWCSTSNTVSGSYTIKKGDACDSVVVDDLSHCILVATDENNCAVSSGDPKTGSDYVGQACCIITAGAGSWNIHDNGVCINPCQSSTSSTTTSSSGTSSSTSSSSSSGTSSTTSETTSTTETSGSRGSLFAVTVGAAAAASSMIIAFIL